MPNNNVSATSNVSKSSRKGAQWVTAPQYVKIVAANAELKLEVWRTGFGKTSVGEIHYEVESVVEMDSDANLSKSELCEKYAQDGEFGIEIVTTLHSAGY